MKTGFAEERSPAKQLTFIALPKAMKSHLTHIILTYQAALASWPPKEKLISAKHMTLKLRLDYQASI